jgi:hypothetical protein
MNTQPRAANRPYDLATLMYLALVAIVICGFAVGCSKERVAPVDEPGAREALRTTLESWRNGDLIGAIKDRSPSIVAQDMDWEAGRTLIKYEVLDEGRNESVNLRIPVDLTLRDQAGKEVKKKVKYVVGTSPVITVFREIF